MPVWDSYSTSEIHTDCISFWEQFYQSLAIYPNDCLKMQNSDVYASVIRTIAFVSIVMKWLLYNGSCLKLHQKTLYVYVVTMANISYSIQYRRWFEQSSIQRHAVQSVWILTQDMWRKKSNLCTIHQEYTFNIAASLGIVWNVYFIPTVSIFMVWRNYLKKNFFFHLSFRFYSNIHWCMEAMHFVWNTVTCYPWKWSGNNVCRTLTVKFRWTRKYRSSIDWLIKTFAFAFKQFSIKAIQIRRI